MHRAHRQHTILIHLLMKITIFQRGFDSFSELVENNWIKFDYLLLNWLNILNLIETGIIIFRHHHDKQKSSFRGRKIPLEIHYTNFLWIWQVILITIWLIYVVLWGFYSEIQGVIQRKENEQNYTMNEFKNKIEFMWEFKHWSFNFKTLVFY